jgi:diguanylate cyclase (GGDEF)-like protein
VRESDSAARLGGDEFAVLFEPINSVREARNTVGRIGRCLKKEPVMIGDIVDVLRPSIGLAIYPQDGSTPGELLRVADLAMYQAKKSAALAVTEGVEVRRHRETATDAGMEIANKKEDKQHQVQAQTRTLTGQAA